MKKYSKILSIILLTLCILLSPFTASFRQFNVSAETESVGFSAENSSDSSQQWRFTPFSAGLSGTTGWTSDVTNLLWKIQPVSGALDSYRIVNVTTGLALTATEEGNSNSGFKAELLPIDENNEAQIWKALYFTEGSNNYYNFVNLSLNKVLELTEKGIARLWNHNSSTENYKGNPNLTFAFGTGSQGSSEYFKNIDVAVVNSDGCRLIRYNSADYSLKADLIQSWYIQTVDNNYLTLNEDGSLLTDEKSESKNQRWELATGYDGYLSLKNVIENTYLAYDESKGGISWKYTDSDPSTSVALNGDKSITVPIVGKYYMLKLHPDYSKDGRRLALAVQSVDSGGSVHNVKFFSYTDNDRNNPTLQWKIIAESSDLKTSNDWGIISQHKWEMIKRTDGNVEYWILKNVASGLVLTNDKGILREMPLEENNDYQLWLMPLVHVNWPAGNPNYNIISKADGLFMAVNEDGTVTLDYLGTETSTEMAYVFVFSAFGAAPYDGYKTTIQARGGSWGIYSLGNVESYRVINRNTGAYLTQIDDGLFTNIKKLEDGTQSWKLSTQSTDSEYAVLENVKSGKVIAFDALAENNISFGYSSGDRNASLLLTDGSESTLNPDSEEYYFIAASSEFNLQGNTAVLGDDSVPDELTISEGVLLSDTTGSRLQKWMFNELELDDEIYYYITNSGYNAYSLSEIKDTVVLLETNSSRDDQLWTLREKNDGYYTLKNKASGRYLIVSDGKLSSVENDNGDAVLFKFGGETELSDGITTMLIPKVEDGKRLTAAVQSVKPKQADSDIYKVVSASSFPHDSIRWRLIEDIYNGKTVYSLQNVNTGYFLTTNSAQAGTFLAEEAYGDETQYYVFVEESEGSGSYEIRPLGWPNAVLVWPDNYGLMTDEEGNECYGKRMGIGAVNSGYEWILNNSNDFVPYDGAVVTICSQRGWIRATGDDEDYGIIREDNRVIYVSNDGDDSNDGLSESTPIKTVERANQLIEEMQFTAGNQILFRKGDVFVGELTLIGKYGKTDKPIYIGSYGSGSERPLLRAPEITNGTLSSDNLKMVLEAIEKSGIPEKEFNEIIPAPVDTETYSAIRINSCNHVTVENIDFYSTNDSSKWYSHYNNPNAVVWVRDTFWITIRNSNISAETVKRTKNTIADNDYTVYYEPFYGNIQYPYLGNDYWGLAVTNSYNNEVGDYSNIIIENVNVTKSIGITVDGIGFSVKNCKVYDSPAWGFSVTGKNGEIVNCVCDNTGYGQNSAGNAAFMAIRCTDVIFDGIIAQNIKRGPQVYDGVGFDFEGTNNRVTLRNSTFKNIEGPAIMVFTGINKDFLIDSCNISEYCLVGAEGFEGGINFAASPSNFRNSGTVINTTIVRSGSAPFFTGFYNPDGDPNEVYSSVFFVKCNFLAEKTDMSELKKLVEQAETLLNTSNATEDDLSLLQNAIDSATIVISNEYSVPSIVEGAVDALKKAINDFIKAAEDAENSESNVSDSHTNVSDQDFSALDQMVSNGNDVKNPDTFDLQDFKLLVDSAKNNGNSNVVINGKELPIITSEMLNELKSAGLGIVLQLLDENEQLIARFTISEVLSAESDLDLTILTEALNKDDMLKNMENATSQIIAFKSVGALPGTMQVIFKNNGGFTSNDNLKLLLWDEESGSFKDCGIVQVSNDGGYIAFSVASTGEYLVRATTAKEQSNTPKSGNEPLFNWLWIVIPVTIIVITGAVLIIILVKKRKKIKENTI